MKCLSAPFTILFVVACVLGGLYIQSENRVKLLSQEMGPTYWNNQKLEELFQMGVEAHQDMIRIANGAALSENPKDYLSQEMPKHIEKVDMEYLKIIAMYSRTPST